MWFWWFNKLFGDDLTNNWLDESANKWTDENNNEWEIN